MQSVRRSERVSYTARQMFDLVNDVENYPKFLHWCSGARVIRREDEVIEAEIDVGLSGIHKSFSTRNRLNAPHEISISLLAGPFRRLDGQWSFEDLVEGGCRVSLAVNFEVKRSPFSMIFSRIFEEIAGTQLNAFLKRAKALYG